MTNVSKGMEYATTFEREAMREKLDAALGDLEPQKQEWVGLTEEEKAYSNTNYLGKSAEAWQGGVEWAEDKLKEKNR